MYSKIVLNLFNKPKNAGRISKPDGIANLNNEDNTSHVEFSLRIDTGIIVVPSGLSTVSPTIVFTSIISLSELIAVTIKFSIGCSAIFFTPFLKD